MVRMLCRRSAILTSTTRTSRAIASTIFCMFEACASAWLLNMADSLETPSTSSATGLPKRFPKVAFATAVSSITSCRRAAISVSWSMRICARMAATAKGWEM